MANTTLPAGVRLAMDYTEEIDWGLEATEMEGGPGKQRPKFSRAIKKRKAKVVALSLPAKLAFDKWMDEDLNGGCAWFDFTDTDLNQILQARFVMPKLQWRRMAKHLWECTVVIETMGI